MLKLLFEAYIIEHTWRVLNDICLVQLWPSGRIGNKVYLEAKLLYKGRNTINKFFINGRIAIKRVRVNPPESPKKHKKASPDSYENSWFFLRVALLPPLYPQWR